METTDPIQPIRQMLLNVFAQDAIEPMVAMTAMVQLAAKIAYDAGKQNGLSDIDNANRWVGGCMLAFDAVAGGKVFGTGTEDVVKRHLSLCASVGIGAKTGLSHRRKLERERSRAANKVARASRKKLRK